LDVLHHIPSSCIIDINGKPLAIIDVETTGCNPLRDRVIEIAVIRTDGTGEFSSLVNPARSLPPFITSLTGITVEKLADAPRFEEIAAEIADLLEGAVFTAHNARFDYAFVRNEFKRIGISFTAPTLCTVRLSRKLYPKQRKHSLETIIERHDISVENRHRALADARAVAAFLEISREEIGVAPFTAALSKLLKIPSLPPNVSEDMILALPESPGVYLFFGEKGETLYVGKSVNIRERVLSHFSGDNGSAKEMALCSRVTSIEARPTTGELSALLLESDLVKELSPVYNRRLKKRRKMVVAESMITEAGYETIRCSVVDGTTTNPNTALAQYRNTRQAEEEIASLAKTFELCPKLLGIEKGKGACFSHQLKRCHGACVGQEAPESYNRRFRAAFSSRLFADWPFSTPVLVTEARGNGFGMAYAVDRWRVLASIEFESEDIFRIRDRERPFDHDIYTILAGFISKPNDTVSVRPLSMRELSALMGEQHFP
jgi:DNA polymerase-3 subunit epsilon